MQENRRRASTPIYPTPTLDWEYGKNETRDARLDTTPNVATPIVLRPSHLREHTKDEPRDAIQDAGKPTPRAAKRIVPTPRQCTEFCKDKLQDAIRHDVGISTPSVATPMHPKLDDVKC